MIIVLLGGSDYEVVSQILTFRPDSRTVSTAVPLIDDDLNEGLEEFTLQLVLTDEQLGMPDVLRESTVRIFDDEGMTYCTWVHVYGSMQTARVSISGNGALVPVVVSHILLTVASSIIKEKLRVHEV